MPKPNTGCKNNFENVNELLYPQHHFVGLDENTTDQDYLNYKIFH
jgi:hypothetical protein